MKGKRLWHSLRLCMISSATKRAEYFRRHEIFDSMGIGCTTMKRKVPLNPKMIRIGDNVHFASNVGLITHDITHLMLNNCEELKLKGRIIETKGCIEIGSNVFIGAGTRILPNTKIGSNVVIGAGSIVNKDIPDNSVVAGVPAKVIGDFDTFAQKRLNQSVGVGKKSVSQYWQEFDNERE